MEFKYGKEFLQDLIHIINRYGIDNEMNTPDYLIAEHLFEEMKTLGLTINRRDLHMNLTKGDE